MVCPHCHSDLIPTDRKGVEIDYCPRCSGVWLDRGELEKILERSREAVTRYRPYDDDDGKDYGRPRKKRENFLEELFDF